MGKKYWASSGEGEVLDGPGMGLLGFGLSYTVKSWFLRKRLAPLFYATNTWHWVSLKVSSHVRDLASDSIDSGTGGNPADLRRKRENQHREL